MKETPSARPTWRSTLGRSINLESVEYFCPWVTFFKRCGDDWRSRFDSDQASWERAHSAFRDPVQYHFAALIASGGRRILRGQRKGAEW